MINAQKEVKNDIKEDGVIIWWRTTVPIEKRFTSEKKLKKENTATKVFWMQYSTL